MEPHRHAPRIILIFMPGTSLSVVAHMHCQAVEAEAAVLSARADGMAGVAETRTVRCRWQLRGGDVKCRMQADNKSM